MNLKKSVSALKASFTWAISEDPAVSWTPGLWESVDGEIHDLSFDSIRALYVKFKSH